MKLFLMIVLSFIAGVYSAFVFLMLYTWFGVPVFNLPSINIWQGLGIVYLVRFATHQKPCKEEPKRQALESFLEALSYSVVYSTVTLFFGFLIHLITK